MTESVASLRITISALQDRIKQLETQSDFTICPITHETISNMVVCSTDGRCYEAAAMQAWLTINPVSPMTKAITMPSSLHHAKNIHDHIIRLHSELQKSQVKAAEEYIARAKAEIRDKHNTEQLEKWKASFNLKLNQLEERIENRQTRVECLQAQY